MILDILQKIVFAGNAYVLIIDQLRRRINDDHVKFVLLFLT